jgi:hypothetical protein
MNFNAFRGDSRKLVRGLIVKVKFCSLYLTFRPGRLRQQNVLKTFSAYTKSTDITLSASQKASV